MKKRGLSIFLAVVLVTLLLFAACAAPAPTPPPTPKIPALALATWPSGTQTYIVSVGISELAKKYAGITMSVEPTEGPPAWMPLLGKGEIDMGYMTTMEAHDAYYGVAMFEKEGQQPLRLLLVSYASQHVLYTRPDTGIKTIPDLRDKKVSIYTPPSLALTIVAPLALEAFGLLPDKDYVAISHSGKTEKQEALIEGRIDAYYYTFPGTHALEVKRAVGLVVVPLPEKSVQYIKEKTGYPCFLSEIKPELAKMYGIPEGMKTFSYATCIVAREDLPGEATYQVLKAVYDHFDEFAPIHTRCAETTLENAVSLPPIPFHDGAIRYYKEAGVWTPELESLQEQLLAKRK